MPFPCQISPWGMENTFAQLCESYKKYVLNLNKADFGYLRIEILIIKRETELIHFLI